MFLMLCAPLDWQYAELPSSVVMQSCVLCSFVRCWTSKQIEFFYLFLCIATTLFWMIFIDLFVDKKYILLLAIVVNCTLKY